MFISYSHARREIALLARSVLEGHLGESRFFDFDHECDPPLRLAERKRLSRVLVGDDIDVLAGRIRTPFYYTTSKLSFAIGETPYFHTRGVAKQMQADYHEYRAAFVQRLCDRSDGQNEVILYYSNNGYEGNWVTVKRCNSWSVVEFNKSW